MDSLFSTQCFAPPFGGQSIQFAAAGVSRGRSATSRPGYTHAHAPPGGISINGRYYTGGQFIPREALDQADDETIQALDQSGHLKQDGGDPSVNTGPQQPGEVPSNDATLGGVAPPLPAPPPRTRPRRISPSVVGIHGQGEEDRQLVNHAVAWLSQPSPRPLPDPDDEAAWTQLAPGPEALPGLLFASLASQNRRHKAGEYIARGIVQALGPDMRQLLPLLQQAHPVGLLSNVALHPEMQMHLARFSRDPMGRTLADQEVLWRAARTVADSPESLVLAGRLVGQMLLASAMPQPPQPNPDLQFDARGTTSGTTCAETDSR